MRYLIVICFLLYFGGCKEDSSCKISFWIAGTVVDQNDTALEGVEVYTQDDIGGPPAKWAVTDVNGKFTFFRGTYKTMGNEFVFFRKAGYVDVTTQAIGKGDSSCGDQQDCKGCRDGTVSITHVKKHKCIAILTFPTPSTRGFFKSVLLLTETLEDV